MTDPTDDTADEETFSAVTWLEANNAETQAMLLGRFEEGEVLGVPEIHDRTPVRARRHFDPVEVVDLPEPMEGDAAVEWVNDHRDLDEFDDYDWEDHDRREYLDTIVENRNSTRQMLAHFEERLRNLNVVGVEAQSELEEIRAEMGEAMTSGPAVSVNRVEEPGEVEA